MKRVLTLFIAALTTMTTAVAAPDGITALTKERGHPNVLVFNSDSEAIDAFIRGMQGEIESEYDIYSYRPNRKTSPSDMLEVIEEVEPALVVLMDNPIVSLYSEVQRSAPEFDFPPGIVVMALFYEQATRNVQTVTGIQYEVPGVTSIVGLRRVVDTPIRKVGVIHRPRFGSFIEEQTRLAAIEKIEIVAVEVGAKPKIGEVKKGLKTLRAEGVDAFWVLNDNVLLSSELLEWAWLPQLDSADEPVIVGVDSLLSLASPFGSFAVLPDHESLGMQAAELIFELGDVNFDVTKVDPQLPIAVETVLNITIAESRFELREGAEDSVDRVVEQRQR